MFLAVAASGCAGYPERAGRALAQYRAGALDEAATSFESGDVTDSAFLSGAEVGMIRLSAGEWEAARDALTRAAEAARDAEEKSLLSVSEGAESVGTLLVNDTVAAYTGEGYERVLVHAALAIAYLALGDVSGMRVETRRANQVLEGEEALYETKYGAGGLGHLLSAVSYEMERRLDEALIDYRRMVEKGVGLEIAGPRLRELADFFGRDDVAELVADYEPAVSTDEPYATVWVLGAMGLAPQKVERSLNLPTPVGFVRMTAPDYVSSGGARTLTLVLPDAGESVACTVVEDVDAVSRENLSDRLAWIAARTAVRAGIRAGVHEYVEKEHGALAAFGVDVLGLALERADLRSWLTLPREWQAARAVLPPGGPHPRTDHLRRRQRPTRSLRTGGRRDHADLRA
ncbi:MAG: hypothetical protein R3F34_03735 [Planctomycetota bacterium]